MLPATPPPPYPSTLLQNSLRSDEHYKALLLDVADFLAFDEDPQGKEEHHDMATAQQTQPDELLLHTDGGRGNRTKIGRCLPESSASGRISFRTKSEIESLDDGYRWRKYGKQMVKNSPHPRNCYRCFEQGYSVKKRVERERDDSRFVITSYVGVHNHEAASPATDESNSGLT